MGGCQIKNPCDKEIRSNQSNPIILNEINEINNDEPKVSNEDIKISLPISPTSGISKIDFNNNKIKEQKLPSQSNNKIEDINNKDIKDDNGHNLDNNKINNSYDKIEDCQKNKAIISNYISIKNKENQNNSYENLKIEEIISEEKIHTKNNHEVVFRGNLLLLSRNKDFEKMIVYCVMSRINIKLYKNINSFLKMKKPLFIIDLKKSKNMELIKDDELGLCFSLLDKYIFNSQNPEQLFKWIVIINYFSNKL